MSTKTMRLPPRRFLTPSKRKERDGFINSVNKPSITKITAPTTVPSTLPKPTTHPEPAKSNQLLAGYLADEFLSKGTLFGQTLDPDSARAEILAKKEKVMMSYQKAEPEPSRRGGGRRDEERKDKCERYVEVSDLLMREGAHIEGIVNPTQLARLLQM